MSIASTEACHTYCEPKPRGPPDEGSLRFPTAVIVAAPSPKTRDRSDPAATPLQFYCQRSAILQPTKGPRKTAGFYHRRRLRPRVVLAKCLQEWQFLRN